MKNTTVRFRCIPNPNVIFTPAYDFEVAEMRKHKEYEEIDADGNVVKQPEDGIQRPLVSVAPPKAPSKRKK
jgi:hypothetical protein